MIIPVRCFTCGKVLANKWMKYLEEVKELESKKSGDESELATNFDPILRAEILDKLFIDRICCRRHLLSHCDIIDNI
jgi:DNA-directed RNA polymerase subunit N (RpoN/RPB10)